MRVGIKPGALKETKWYEYAIRFLFGGLVTVMAGAIAHRFGPVVGGLFLAFPAIFPATATLVEKHERKRKEKKGVSGRKRGRQAASVEAAGAALGSIGLVAFGGVVWCFSTCTPAWGVLAGATLAWGAVSVLAWMIRKKI